MAEKTDEAKTSERLFHRPLKDADVSQLESEIASALGRLVGKEYIAQIKNLDFEPERMAFMHDAVEIRVLVRNPYSFDNVLKSNSE